MAEKKQAEKKQAEKKQAENGNGNEESTRNPNTKSVCFDDKSLAVVESIPKFLRSKYICECVEQRVRREGMPKFSAEERKSAGQGMAVRRAMGVLTKLTPAQLAALGISVRTPTK